MRTKQWEVTFRRAGRGSDDSYRVHARGRKDAIDLAREYLQGEYGFAAALRAHLIDAALMPHERQ